MLQQKPSYVTPQEYLDYERQAETKSEYYNGEIYALASASPRHTVIAANIIVSFGVQFKGRSCTVHTGDLRVKVSPTGLYTYPDVVVVCDKLRFDDARKDTLLNPTLIVEVLSESTEAYDRTGKFEHYRTLESLTDYLLVSQEKAWIEHRARQSDIKWLTGYYMGLETIVPLPAIDCELRLADVYDKIDWPDESSARGWLQAVKEPAPEYATERRPPYHVN
ncbi:MAG: Uma2 family endonuclease [Anaerolineae bacterium]|nr:Uma2 family endonuclease [Anaerolineae bacterium]